MPPIGNDIVDLADPENIGKSKDRRFCSRVFNNEELSMIANSAQPDRFLWAIWAAKEAAYKAISRREPTVCSIPQRYPVIIEDESARRMSVCRQGISTCLDGTITTPQGELAVAISLDEEIIYAVAAQTVEVLAGIVSRVERVDPAKDDPSDVARRILLEEIARRFGWSTDDLSVIKEKSGPGIPFVVFRGQKLFAEISLSHDGRFVSFAFDPSTF